MLAKGLNMLLCNDKSSLCSFPVGRRAGSWQLLAYDKKRFAAGWFVLLLCSFRLLLIRGGWQTRLGFRQGHAISCNWITKYLSLDTKAEALIMNHWIGEY